MSSNWYKLTDLTRDKEFLVTQVRLKESAIAINGEFELPPMARLSDEDQVFAAHFIRTHGSIKEMETAFGISYPTVKSRLNKIANQLPLFETILPKKTHSDILTKLEQGEISAKQATEALKQ